MNGFYPFWAGLLGTAAMSVFTFLIFILLRKPYRVVLILADMLQFRKTTSPDAIPPTGFLICATLLHYAIGILFTTEYDLSIARGLLDLSIVHSLVYGAIIGIIGIVGWRIFFALHPNPPRISLVVYLSVIWLGHLILSFVIRYVYLLYQNT
jgi:hypothetical protein